MVRSSQLLCIGLRNIPQQSVLLRSCSGRSWSIVGSSAGRSTKSRRVTVQPFGLPRLNPRHEPHPGPAPYFGFFSTTFKVLFTQFVFSLTPATNHIRDPLPILLFFNHFLGSTHPICFFLNPRHEPHPGPAPYFAFFQPLFRFRSPNLFFPQPPPQTTPGTRSLFCFFFNHFLGSAHPICFFLDPRHEPHPGPNPYFAFFQTHIMTSSSIWF